jgi:hypothetical protein
MRGAERPANVRWSHPFLEPLRPLTQDAARKTFIDIVDDGYSNEEIDKILLLADNMPLAIDLIAHLVDYDGFSSVLSRWEIEKTSLVSQGYDKGSNLDLSISLSLKSPRLQSILHARDLLSLLSILPDGISETELLQVELPIDNLFACKTALLRTSLAYTDSQKRLKVLVPIREYVLKMHPPVADLVQPLLNHFHGLLEIFETYLGTVSAPGIIGLITSNFSNIQKMLVQGFNKDNADLVNTIYCICRFDVFSRLTGHGKSHLIDQIPSIPVQPRDHRLEVYVLTLRFAGLRYHLPSKPDHLVEQALESLSQFDDPELKCSWQLNFFINSY